jgi:hypothetical protein
MTVQTPPDSWRLFAERLQLGSQDRLHRAEGFCRFAFREADPRSILFRVVLTRRITGIR